VVHVTRIGDERSAGRFLEGTPEGKRPFVRPRLRWRDNIKMAFKKWNGEAWTV
jgi:hypothetical protein